MPDLEYSEKPQLRRSLMVVAFAGWPDASESATRAAKFLVRSLKATRFATIDPEEFYNFTELRPDISTARSGRRVLSWPRNQFYAWRPDDPQQRDLVIFVGNEPHLKWKRFTALMMEVVRTCNVELVVTLGALLDAVPHTRPARVTASASEEKLGAGLDHIRLGPSRYDGPTGITSILLDAVRRRGIPGASLWGHAPHYLQVRPNPLVTLALLKNLQLFIHHQMSLRSLDRAAAEFRKSVSRALDHQEEVRKYITQLEEKYDAEGSHAGATELAPGDADALLAEVEEFLRRRQNDQQSGEHRA